MEFCHCAHYTISVRAGVMVSVMMMMVAVVMVIKIIGTYFKCFANVI